LLAGQSALFDRESGCVADGIDVGYARHVTVRVDGNEPVEVRRNAGRPRAVEQRQAYDSVGFDALALLVEENGARPYIGADRADEGDALGLEHPVYDAARCGAEDRQRFPLRGDEPVSGTVDPDRPAVPGGHDRQLIQRQRPRRATRNHECDLADVAPFEIRDQVGQGLGRVGTAECDRVPEGRERSCADGEYQLVVGHHGAARRADLVPFVGYPRERVRQEAGAEVIGELRECAAVRASGCEWLRGAGRPVGEIGIRRHHRDADAVGRQLPESKYELERGDAAAGDGDFQRGRSSGCCHPAMEAKPPTIVP
jgi:hypothetical protein